MSNIPDQSKLADKEREELSRLVKKGCILTFQVHQELFVKKE